MVKGKNVYLGIKDAVKHTKLGVKEREFANQSGVIGKWI